MDNLQIIESQIRLEVYLDMRQKCGLSEKTEKAAEIGLKNSIYSVMIKDGDAVIGMGRLIGDGGCFCQVVDICVDPAYQGNGIGKLIMQQLSAFIQNKLPPSCYVSLIADGDAGYLYEKFGFRDTMPQSKGMYIKVGNVSKS